MKSIFSFLAFQIFSIFPLLAILDTNTNGLSDVWEKQYNSLQLFTTSNTTHAATADPDQDGWTNAQEALAGTDPFSASGPNGKTALAIQSTATAATYELTWPVIPGKNYRIQASTNLHFWVNIGPIINAAANDTTHTIAIQATDPENTAATSPPPRLFYRIKVIDRDEDLDQLTTAEEFALGLNSESSYTLNGIGDKWLATHYLTELLTNGIYSISFNADLDQDGVSDRDELRAGTDPNSAQSHQPLFFTIYRGGFFGCERLNLVPVSYNGDLHTSASWLPNSGETEKLITQLTSEQLKQRLTTHFPFPANPVATIYSIPSIINSHYIEKQGEEVRYESARVDESRTWMAVDKPVSKDTVNAYLKATWKGINYENHIINPIIKDVTKHDYLIKQGKKISEPIDLAYEDFNTDEDYILYETGLIPLYNAPEVLAVNSDFDEGRINPTTGYAIPDCDDEEIALEAVRNHLDGNHQIHQRITEDLHPGFFGVLPYHVDDAFWDGATVTIKKIDKIDATTGYQESGQVRFYGKWGNEAGEYRAIVPYDFTTLEAVNLVTGGVNGEPNESVYGTNSPFGAGTAFFMEGVHPGKITLEWRYQKGSIDIKHEQTFLVCTQKNALQWNNELAYKIRLETDNDPSGQVDIRNTPLPSEDYWPRMERISEYYDFYQECYREPLRSHPTGPENAMSWPGLARLAGSQVVAGLSDSEYARVPVAGLGWLTFDDLGIDWTEQQIKDVQHELFFGGKEIFRSIGWQMHAFRSSGFWALDWVAENDSNDEEARELQIMNVWRNLYDGIKTGDVAKLNLSAEEITNREQNVTIVETWDHINAMLGGAVSSTFSYLAKNSMYPLGDDFRDLYPAPKQMTITTDRWDWIKPTTPTGILNTWNTAPIATKHGYVYGHLTTDAKRFSLAKITSFDTYTNSIITVHLPIKCNDEKDVP